MRGDKFHSGVPTDRPCKSSVSRLPARTRQFHDPKIAAIAMVAAACGAVMLDDQSSASPAARGLDLVSGRVGSFTRGGVASPTSQVQAAPGTANQITGITTANPGVVTTSSAHGLTTGAVVGIAGTTGATQANGVWTVTVLSPTTFSIPVNVTGTFGGSPFWLPALPATEVTGKGTALLDLVLSAISGTGTPTLTVSIYTSFDNGATDTYRLAASFTAATATGTSRKAFTGLDRWIVAVPQLSGTTPAVTYTVSGELV